MAISIFLDSPHVRSSVPKVLALNTTNDNWTSAGVTISRILRYSDDRRVVRLVRIKMTAFFVNPVGL